MKPRHWLPLVGFVVPTVLIGYGIVIPRSCIAGINELSLLLGGGGDEPGSAEKPRRIW